MSIVITFSFLNIRRKKEAKDLTTKGSQTAVLDFPGHIIITLHSRVQCLTHKICQMKPNSKEDSNQ